MEHFDDARLFRFIIPNLVNVRSFIAGIRCALMEIWGPKLADFYKEIYAMGQRLPPWSLTERVAH